MEELRSVAMKNPVHPGAVLRQDVLADLGLGVGEVERASGSPTVRRLVELA